MRALLVSLLALAVGCVPTLPEGRYVCSDEAQCPPGWACLEGLCRSRPAPEDAGAPAFDASSTDASTPDASMLDASTGDAALADAAAADAGSTDGGGVDAGVADAGTGGCAGADGGCPAGLGADLVVGRAHGCVRTAAGDVHCWGDNSQQQRGSGDRMASITAPGSAPRVPLGSPARALCAGGDQTCALQVDGGITCWGADLAPHALPSLPGVTSLTCGGHKPDGLLGSVEHHVCAVAGGQVSCLGSSGNGQGGASTSVLTGWSPVSIGGTVDATVVEVSAGGAHTCARTREGEVFCWGDARYGQLGPASSSSTSPTPLRVAVGPASALASGLLHSCAVVGGEVSCWGDARTGQVGMVSPTPLGVTAVTLPSVARDVATLATGLFHSCAVATDGSVRCWGSDGFGELGDGTVCTGPLVDGLPFCGDTALAGVPIFLASAVAAGERFSCAIRRDAPEGTVWCWGYNAQFRLGDGTTARRLAPVPVTVLP